MEDNFKKIDEINLIAKDLIFKLFALEKFHSLRTQPDCDFCEFNFSNNYNKVKIAEEISKDEIIPYRNKGNCMSFVSSRGIMNMNASYVNEDHIKQIYSEYTNKEKKDNRKLYKLLRDCNINKETSTSILIDYVSYCHFYNEKWFQELFEFWKNKIYQFLPEEIRYKKDGKFFLDYFMFSNGRTALTYLELLRTPFSSMITIPYIWKYFEEEYDIKFDNAEEGLWFFSNLSRILIPGFYEQYSYPYPNKFAGYVSFTNVIRRFEQDNEKISINNACTNSSFNNVISTNLNLKSIESKNMIKLIENHPILEYGKLTENIFSEKFLFYNLLYELIIDESFKIKNLL